MTVNYRAIMVRLMYLTATLIGTSPDKMASALEVRMTANQGVITVNLVSMT